MNTARVLDVAGVISHSTPHGRSLAAGVRNLQAWSLPAPAGIAPVKVTTNTTATELKKTKKIMVCHHVFGYYLNLNLVFLSRSYPLLEYKLGVPE